MRISELAKRSGISARMLRHYESLGLLKPSGRTMAGYREYSEADVWRLFQVASLRSLGLGLAEVGQALGQQAPRPDVLIDELISRSQQRLAAEQELLARLSAVRAALPADWPGVLDVVQLLNKLDSAHAPVRQRAALDAAISGAPLAEGVAQALLQEQEPNVAGALRWALGRTEGNGIGVLGAALRSADADVRERAVLALAYVGSAEALDRLQEPLSDSAARIRYRVARILGARGVRDAIPLLVEQIVVGDHDVEAADALAALAEDPATSGQIVSHLEAAAADAQHDVQARIRISQALAEIPGAAATELLAQLAVDPAPEVARNAVYVIGMRSGTAP
ncbi:MerR family DNA-binding transcriptional regulator [Achromobacter sp. SD115]|uniref:HEAT repeat domain-containing protein n=1 Tax=Achromobacter sp. SD115 TaxID=2782011 RepID=UPI001A96E1FF|nr:HEAT repeat domain-containing protein [Achromobacter sp. SD115]MBO1016016.1 MerR family DNA-binding transcriptional regulator [Achromobacter sp. SD115]